jgi:DNA replication protein DnaC
VIKLSSLDFIEQKENVIFLGPPGVGKTHLAVGLAMKACMARYRVLFTTAQKLIEDLVLSKRDGSIMEKLMTYCRLHLLIIDELGYMPITREQANLLFQLISIRYEKGSIILTSNYNFDEWGKVFDDNVVASAIIDRLVHHASIFYITGSSYRLKNKLKKVK